jgi:hypothetical protein
MVERPPNWPQQESRLLGPNFRIGTQLFTHGPFTIRADVFGRAAVGQQLFGPTTTTLGEAAPFIAGVTVMGFLISD